MKGSEPVERFCVGIGRLLENSFEDRAGFPYRRKVDGPPSVGIPQFRICTVFKQSVYHFASAGSCRNHKGRTAPVVPVIDIGSRVYELEHHGWVVMAHGQHKRGVTGSCCNIHGTAGLEEKPNGRPSVEGRGKHQGIPAIPCPAGDLGTVVEESFYNTGIVVLRGNHKWSDSPGTCPVNIGSVF